MTTTMDGAVAVVTGAAGGIGEEICRALRTAGVSVALVDLDQRSLDEVVDRLGDGPPLATFALDLTDDALVAALPDRVAGELGPAAMLVNNAGVRKLGYLLEIDPADWRRTVDVDLTAPFLLVRAFPPGMIEIGRGKIVNIASMYGQVAPDGRLYAAREGQSPFHYGPAKAALLQLTRHLAAELGPQGIRVNALVPGAFPARIDPELACRLAGRTMLGRLGQPAEIAGPLLFLASPASSYMTGAALNIDGGWTAW